MILSKLSKLLQRFDRMSEKMNVREESYAPVISELKAAIYQSFYKLANLNTELTCTICGVLLEQVSQAF